MGNDDYCRTSKLMSRALEDERRWGIRGHYVCFDQGDRFDR